MAGAQRSVERPMMRVVALLVALTCQDAARDRYERCIEWCPHYMTSAEYRSCMRRCGEERKEDEESCKLE
jgi:hypothetical protein